MSEQDRERFKTLMATSAAITKDELENVLHNCGEVLATSNVRCIFYLVRCTSDGFRDSDLVTLMSNMLIKYVLKKRDYQELTTETARRIHLAAKEAFVPTANSGEAGELLLFLLLEANGIVQVFSKMDLKTNPKMHFHGYDAVHIQVGERIEFHFGHAKMHANFAGALSEALNDVKLFGQNIVQNAREFKLAADHIDEEKFGIYTSTVRNLLNPYYKNKEDYAKVNSIFIGANWAFAKNNPTTPDGTLDDYMRTEYGKQLASVSSQIGNGVSSRPGIAAQRFLFFLIPFANVEDFRTRFRQELAR